MASTGYGPHPVGPGAWARWGSSSGLPHVPRGLPAPAPEEAPRTTVDKLRLAMTAEHVYESVDALAYALQAQLDSLSPGSVGTRHASPSSPAGSGPLLVPGGSH
jgi:hypothetical protein